MKAIVDCNNFYYSCERLFKPHLDKQPVVVLSNNDGCIISRSDEATQLGVEMAGPYFKAKPLIQKHNVATFSSNSGRLFVDTLGRSGKDMVDAAKTIGGAARSAGRRLGHTLTGLREVVSDRRAQAQAARAGVRGLTDGMRLAGRVAEGVAGAAAGGLIAAQDAAGRVYQNPGLLKSAAGAAAKALWQQLTDPKVLWGALKEFSGLQNFENALDPKRSLLQRIGEVGAGTFKLYGAAQMAASAASAARDAASRAFGGGKAAAGALGGRGAASTAARTGVRPPNPVAPGSVAPIAQHLQYVLPYSKRIMGSLSRTLSECKLFQIIRPHSIGGVGL